jgi:flagellar motor switch protein FliG
VTPMTSTRKTAIVLISMGSRIAGEILKRMPEALVEQITAEIASIKQVTPEERRLVFKELREFQAKISAFDKGGTDFAREMLEQAVGTHRASTLISRATGFGDTASFEMLKKADPLTVANFLKAEAAQTVALVLAHVDPRWAGPILARLPSTMQAEVAFRMASLGQPNPEFVREVELALAKGVKGEYEATVKQYGGTKQVADLFNQIDQEVWGEILEDMKRLDNDTAAQVKNLMFVFEDIVTLDDKFVQEMLKEVDSRELGLALKAASDIVKQKIFSNMSKRAAAGIKEDMEYTGAVRLSEVQEAQQRVVDVLRRLEEAGTVVLSGGKGGDVLV